MPHGYRHSNSMADIPRDREYIGWIRWSDAEWNQEIDGDLPDELFAPASGHFVVEGFLAAKDGSISVSICDVNGAPLVGIVDLTAIPSDAETVDVSFLGFRFDKEPRERVLRFQEVWLPEEDPLCEGMEVLRPAWRAFVGFGKP